ncbi:hypothetical protein Ddc_13762 [Ditylenchus destructor]|nr:hypothetical protein Ddc_13762 [Ditylenchus destructor]
MSYATYAQLNANHLQRLSKGDAEKKRTNPQTINLDRLDESIKSSVARRTTAKPALENSVLNGEQNKLNERKNLISSERVKHANSVVKEEAIDELTAATSVLPNHNGSSSSNFESTASSPKSKRSRKQNFSDLYVEDYNSTQPRTSSSPRLRSKMNRV